MKLYLAAIAGAFTFLALYLLGCGVVYRILRERQARRRIQARVDAICERGEGYGQD